MLSVGPGARHCLPSKDLPVGKSLHVGNIHYRQLPGYRLGSNGSLEVAIRSSCTAVPWSSRGSRLENVDVTFQLLRA